MSDSLRSLRLAEVRRTNHAEEGGSAVVHNAYAAANPPTAEDVNAWGKSLIVFGYDRVALQADITKGSATGIFLVIQVSDTGGPETAEWRDLYADAAGDGVLARKIYSLSVTADMRSAFVISTIGRYMRFNVYAATSGTNCRITVKATRHMDAS